MFDAWELNDSDYSCGPWPRHVRSTLSKPASRYTSRLGHNVFSILDELRWRARIFLGCARSTITHVHRTLLEVRRVLSCEARLALGGVTRIPRSSGNRSRPRGLLVAQRRRTRFCFRGGFRCEVSAFPSSCAIQAPDRVSGSRFIKPSFTSPWIIHGSAV